MTRTLLWTLLVAGLLLSACGRSVPPPDCEIKRTDPKTPDGGIGGTGHTEDKTC